MKEKDLFEMLDRIGMVNMSFEEFQNSLSTYDGVEDLATDIVLMNDHPTLESFFRRLLLKLHDMETK